MVIKSIQLSNFGCYKGEHEPIVFSTDPEKNVTVILGANKSGKTTLVSAFLWCLYGDINLKSGILNSEVKESMNADKSRTVFVEIVLVHSGKEWTIRRSQKFTKKNIRVSPDEPVLRAQYKEPNGEQQSITDKKDCEEAVNNILPKGLSAYFFYEGERFDDISKKDVAAAVRGLMNLDAIANARDRLDPNSKKSVTSHFRNGLLLGDAQESEKLNAELAKAQDDRETVLERIKNAKDEIDFYTRKKEEYGEILSQHVGVRKLQEDRKNIENDIKHAHQNIESTAKQITSYFQKDALSFFSLPLISRAIDAIENSNQDREGIPGMKQGSIDHILERNRCICGCDLNENEGAKKKILSERKLLPPEHIGTSIHSIKKTLLGFRVSSTNYIPTTFDNYKSWRENIRFLESKEKALENIGLQIEKLGFVDIVEIEKNYQKTMTQISEKTTLREDLITEKGGHERIIDDLKGKITSLVSKTENNRKIQVYITYAEALFVWYNTRYVRREKEVKDALNESVNRIFSEMYHGNRIVTIDDNYQINLLTSIGTSREELADTGGLRAVKIFAYITGLVDIARKKVNNKGSDNGNGDEVIDVIDETEPYPLVMDAPFSATDETHINNISRIVSGIAEQVIIVVMQKDWVYAKTAMQNKIGRTYIIENIDNSETVSRIKEAD